MNVVRVAAVVAWVLVGLVGCRASQEPLAEPPRPPAPPPPTSMEPEVPLPEVPVVSSEGCDHPATIAFTEADVANATPFESSCVVEHLDANGCVGERITTELDAEGRPTRQTRLVIDDVVIPLGFVIPTSHVQTFEYDDAGRVARTTFDDRIDGTLDDVRTYAYDDEDRIVRETRIISEAPWVRTVEYDADGNIVHERIDNGGAVRDTVRTWAGEGRLLTETIDDEDDTRLFERANTYDDQGRPLSEREAWLGEGRVETTVYVYGERGLARRTWERAERSGALLIERHVFTRRADATLEREVYEKLREGERILERRTTTYDAAERELSAETDSNVDGVIDFGRRVTYDANGNPLTEVTFRGPRNLRDLAHTYDASDRLVETIDRVRGVITRTVFDGATEEVSTYDLDERLTSRVTTTRDADGHTLSVVQDGDGDGRVDMRSENTWTDDGQRLEGRTDRDGDGTWDFGFRNVYDRAGQPIFATVIGIDDARPVTALTSYACQR